MRRNSPCLATKKLDNYTLIPFQVVPPVLPCCLHLKIISMSSFYHIVCTSTTHTMTSLTSTSGPAFYLHFVLPVLLRLLAWPLHPDCVLKITAAISSEKLPVCIPVQPLKQLWNKLVGVLLVPSSKFYLELSHRWLEVGGCDWLVLGGPECL